MSLLFRQLYDNTSSTFTYLLADSITREAVFIDCVFELHQRDLALLRELDLKLKFVADTHCHADHVSGAWLMKQATGCSIVLSEIYQAKNVDMEVNEGDVLRFGEQSIKVLSTPGHTDGCLSYLLADKSRVFTGDCLMIRSAGRTDFQQGSPAKMYASIREKLFSLPDECLVYPAHDYDGRLNSTIGEEKKYNTRIGGDASEYDFEGYMNNLNLPHPKKIDEAVPANLKSGRPEDKHYPKPVQWGPAECSYDGILQIAPLWVSRHPDALTVVDVRDEEEFKSDPARISNAINIPLDEIQARLKEIPLEKPIMTVCRSGKRSAQAAVLLKKWGVEQDVVNLKQGMLAWYTLFPAARSPEEAAGR